MPYIYGAPFTLKGTKMLLQIPHSLSVIKGQNRGPCLQHPPRSEEGKPITVTLEKNLETNKPL